ncbi:MAG: carboxylate-amine ligase [Leucobacter sp.]
MDLAATYGKPRTIGVEQEFLLVDPENGRPVAASDCILPVTRSRPVPASHPKDKPPTKPRLDSEVKQEQIEVVTPPCNTLDEVAQTIVASRRLVDERAQEFGLRAVALGTSVLPVTSRLAESARYGAMKDQFGLTFNEQLTCGLHVHVGISSDEEGVAVLDRIRPWLPALLAMSSNSPFWDGKDSGYASYRYQAWGRWPTSGPYDIFGSAAAYRRAVSSLIDTEVPLDSGMIYFDARLCEHFPTVEVRVADICMDADHAVAIAALVRALVETAAQEWQNDIQPEPVPTESLRLAMWSASRFGLTKTLLNPLLGTPCDARIVIDALLAHVHPVLLSSGDHLRTESTIDYIFREGTGSERQQATLRRTGSPRAVVTDAIELTHRSGAQTPIDAPA